MDNISIKKIKFDKMSKTLDGNILIGDHDEAYITVSPEKRKIILLSKRDLSEKYFSLQRRFIEFFTKKGLIVFGTDSSGYLPGMFEFNYPENDKNESLNVVLKCVNEFLIEEKEVNDRINKLENEMEKKLLEPDEDESTELGEIPHEKEKGGMVHNPYMNYINSWFGWYM